MYLRELLTYSEIYIQCHDNPDPDTIASGYALYDYFRRQGKKVTLFYAGNRKITKPNIIMLIEELKIPLEYMPNIEEVSGLLLTVDCQYGSGNVTYIKATDVAVIDHHIQEQVLLAKYEIRSELASCSTLVWDMLCEEEIDVNVSVEISTALYYGLFADSSGFAEVRHALDKDMRDSLKYDPVLIRKLKNCVITLKELEIAGMALIRSSYNEANKCVMVRAQECDPNILGIISDFALQVDCVNVVIVYNETHEGIKYSVRSCIKEIMANELAAFLCHNIGNGGGHIDKAAGFISRSKYNRIHSHLNADEYFLTKLTEYYQSYEVICFSECNIEDLDWVDYRKLPFPRGYIKLEEVVPKEMPFVIRCQKEDIEQCSSEKSVLIINERGQVRLVDEEKFNTRYSVLEGDFDMPLNYFPRLRIKQSGQTFYLKNYTKACISNVERRVKAKVLDKAIKLFKDPDDQKYKIGNIGDYLVIERGIHNQILIVEKEVFEKNYEILKRSDSIV